MWKVIGNVLGNVLGKVIPQTPVKNKIDDAQKKLELQIIKLKIIKMFTFHPSSIEKDFYLQ